MNKLIQLFVSQVLKMDGVRKAFDGHKSRIGGLGAFCMGLVYGLPLLVPDVAETTGIQGNLELSIASFTGAFAIWGLSGKLQKAADK